MVVNKHLLSHHSFLSRCCTVQSRCAHFWNNRNIYLSALMQMWCLCWRRSRWAEGWVPALLHWQLPSEVRMSKAARPLCRISQLRRGSHRGDVGRWAARKAEHYEPHFPAEALRWECHFCPCSDKTDFIIISTCSQLWFNIILYHKILRSVKGDLMY